MEAGELEMAASVIFVRIVWKNDMGSRVDADRNPSEPHNRPLAEGRLKGGLLNAFHTCGAGSWKHERVVKPSPSSHKAVVAQQSQD